VKREVCYLHPVTLNTMWIVKVIKVGFLRSLLALLKALVPLAEALLTFAAAMSALFGGKAVEVGR